MIRDSAQAGNRASKTEHHLQRWENSQEWNAVTSATDKLYNLCLVLVALLFTVQWFGYFCCDLKVYKTTSPLAAHLWHSGGPHLLGLDAVATWHVHALACAAHIHALPLTSVYASCVLAWCTPFAATDCITCQTTHQLQMLLAHPHQQPKLQILRLLRRWWESF